MKPDKHKKKRSAQYNKLKGKKDGKKDTQTGAKAGSAAVTASEKDLPGGGKPQQQQQQCPVKLKTAQQQQQQCPVKLKTESSDSSSDTDDDQSRDGKEKRPSFSRRKITSNWSRYDPEERVFPGSESEELEELENLEYKRSVAKAYSKVLEQSKPGDKGRASMRDTEGYFRYKDDRDYDLSSEEESEASTDEQTGIPLHGDVTENSSSVVIPASQEDDLDFLLSLGAKDTTTTTTTTNLDSRISELACNETTTTTPSISACNGTNFPIKVQSSVNSKDKLNETGLNIKKSPLKNGTPQSLKNAEDNEIRTGNTSHVVIPASHEEDDLDFLLSLGAKITTTTNPESKRSEAKCNGTTTTTPSDCHDNNKSVFRTDNVEGTAEIQGNKTVSTCDTSKLQVKDKKSKSDDLEDWLDNLLDD